MEFPNIDLKLWESEVKKIKIKHSMFVERFHANDWHFRRAALVLDDLFNKLFADKIGPLNLRESFYKLAKEYSLFCRPLPSFSDSDIFKDSISKIFDNLRRDTGSDIRMTNFLDFLSVDNYDHSNVLRSTRLALGLTSKTIDELPDGIDPDCIINFLSFLFRNCSSGFLNIGKLIKKGLNHEALEEEEFFFDIRKGFSGILQMILDDDKRKLHCWEFFKVLFSSPIRDPKAVLTYPCIFSDIDKEVDTALTMEDKLKEYHIEPSIRLHTSPRGHHFYWIFKKPVGPSRNLAISAVQNKLAKYLGGDLDRCEPGGTISRLPGLFNYEYFPPHFLDYKVTNYEYDLDDLLKLSIKEGG